MPDTIAPTGPLLPLQPLRLVSTSTSNSPLVAPAHSAAPSLFFANKRPASSASANARTGTLSVSQKPVKRAKLASSTASSSGAAPRGMLKSIAPSSVNKTTLASKTHRTEDRENTPFKLPALPDRYDRAMTPATSTVAHSSSPRRMDTMSSSSPYRTTAGAGPSSILPSITLEKGTTLVFGRHRKSPGDATAHTATLANIISKERMGMLHNADQPGKIIALPRTASHASRVHAAVEYLPLSDSIRVLVLGQNGLRVHGLGLKRVSLKVGERRDIRRTERGVEIDFYGCRVKIAFPSENLAGKGKTRDQELASVQLGAPQVSFKTSPALPAAPPSPMSSLPPSSPPIAALDLDAMSDDEEQPVVPAMRAELEDLFPESDLPESALSTDSPLSSIMDEDDEEPVRLPPSSPTRTSGPLTDPAVSAENLAVKRELIETAAAPNKPVVTPPTRQPSPQPVEEEEDEAEEKIPLPEGVDMLHTLTYSIVFSGSSKLSLPDLVRHMLEPGLKQHGGEDQWSHWAHEVLETNPMFGKVERHGKDASGHPLLPHYFYNPAHDPDETRAKELGGLVRPLRAAQRTGGKALDWRPVGSGRRRY